MSASTPPRSHAGWTATPGYLPPLELGDVVRAAGIGEVVESRCDAYRRR